MIKGYQIELDNDKVRITSVFYKYYCNEDGFVIFYDESDKELLHVNKNHILYIVPLYENTLDKN